MRSRRILIILALCIVAAICSLYTPPWKTIQTYLTSPTIRDFDLFTVEYQARLGNEKREVYRFDPGSIVVHKGEQIRLHIHGFHGAIHHFSIPAFQIQDQVKKGEVKTISFTADRVGTFELICDTHGNIDHEGPMAAYITVVK